MSRPYGYLGRPAGSPATRLTRRARHLIDAAALLGCAVACYAATLALPTVVEHVHPAPTTVQAHGETR